ncbi:DEAD/DEAH box helicase [Leptothermofonsia sichuanensis E412]|uniref:DEAD/DEAH box helicase n=1 Tax=Leptothermofonsia sichuanensis TaxID=2917832 RepID=UPI001CA7672E|nr:DEAD/DEAH box helicase [Leptothermofonsia sichuanensis]QZZ22540.1 DEAD/DEAH box helicase [Leptothermofonsia sichuanensis E412]
MKILHGTWIPETGGEFIQNGAFYLWVETTEQKKFRKDKQRHPRQLLQEELAALLKDELGIQPPNYRQWEDLISPRHFLLPSVDNQPLPSLELSRYLEEEIPETFEWQYWQVDCYKTMTSAKTSTYTAAQVNNVISLLNDLHFIALNNLAEVQLGADLLFWFHYTQALKRIIYKDQYIPALKYRELELDSKKKAGTKQKSAEKTCEVEAEVLPEGQRNYVPETRRSRSTAKRYSRRSQPARMPESRAVVTRAESKSTTGKFEIYPGWEFIGEEYEDIIQEYLSYMPLICVAGFAEPKETPEFYDRATLLRHFSESILTDIVSHTYTTQAFEKNIDGSLLSACLKSPHSPSLISLDQFKQWQAWRDRIVRTQTDLPFHLYFHLQDPAKAEDPWLLQFQVAPKSDPSLRVALDDYWQMRPKQKQQVQKQMGESFEQNLLMNLGYAARIYPRLWSGLETDQPAHIQLDLDSAFGFLKESAWVLENAGYKVIVPAWYTPQGRQRAKVRLRAKGKSLTGGEDKAKKYFSFKTLVQYQYELAIGGEPVSEQEWNQLVNAKTPLVKFRGQWMELDQDKMKQMLEFWKTQQQDNPELSLLDFLKLTASSDDTLELEYDRNSNLAEMMAKLSDKSHLEPVENPKNLQGNLREYQKRGVSWLQYLEQLGLNGCLADDMGLGKTVQVIARLLQEREQAKKSGIKNLPPTLLIAPTSVVGNWFHELAKFAPDLKAIVHHGNQRAKDAKEFKQACREHDVLITSFALARKDARLLGDVNWHRVVLDEAQNIKNPKAGLTRSILTLPSTHRLALTGTPIENRLLDLWSIFNFLNPGYLGNQTQFRRNFELPIQKNNSPQQSAILKKLVEPFILRRVKTDQSIIKDLPDKVEQKLFCNLTKEQASLYEAVVKDVGKQIQGTGGIQRKGLILATLTKLKQICNHPMQFLQDGSDFTPERSHKLTRLTEMVEEVIDEGESLLIFTQFNELGSALEKYLRQTCHYNTYYLHGGTSRKKREQMIEEFQDPESEPSIFVLSLKAGGVGITLTRANHVFHFDRWWNPAVEDQATDRAFRIGQKKNVFVHKFVAIGTLEERIDEMIQDKKKLAGAIVGSDESWLTELDNEAFKKLIALNKSAIME